MTLSAVFIYLVKVMAIQGLFYSFYWLALRGNLRHNLNRAYLIGTLLFSLVIPFIEHPLPLHAEPVLEVTMLEWVAKPIDTNSTPVSATPGWTFPFWAVLKWTYLSVFLVLLFKSLGHLYFLKKIQQQSEYISSNWFKLFKTSYIQPFSFFRSVFIPGSVFGSNAFDQILAHECVHVRQFHSLDRLFVDFLVSLFWFNPFIYLYRNALIEIHEFEADAAVIRQFGDPIGYQEMLFSQLQPVPRYGLVSHFNFSTIKKRIVMMNKTNEVGYSRLVYALTVPVVALVLFAFTSKDGEQSVSRFANEIDKLTEVEPAIIHATDQEDKFRPSILPLKSDASFKVSSTYGMRNNPNSGEEQMHKGLDLATAKGTEVLATADGEVLEVVSSPDGYGNHIVLQHGETFVTKYGQLSEFKVKGGDKVVKGQVIALSGNSGKSTGPHLHYEVYENGIAVNPMGFIKNYTFSMTNVPPPPPVGKVPDPSPVVAPNVDNLEAQEAYLVKIHEEVRLASAERKVVAEIARASASQSVKAALATSVEVKESEERIAKIAKEAELLQQAKIMEETKMASDEERIVIQRKEKIVKEKEAKEKEIATKEKEKLKKKN